MAYEVQAVNNNLMLLSDIVSNNVQEAMSRNEIPNLQKDKEVEEENSSNLSNVSHSDTPSFSSLQMHKLQDRMNQLEKAVLGLGKKESYVAAMAVDLEHIMMILIKRLDREGSDKAVAVF